jgi:PAS domain S-box-containing protein
MVNKKELISRVINENDTMVKLLVTIKHYTPNFNILYLSILLLKFLGMFILSNFFYLANNQQGKKFIHLLQNITNYGIYGKSNFSTYTIACYISYIFIIATIYLFVSVYRNLDINSHYRSLNLIKVLIYLGLGWLLFAQHFIEHFSLVYYTHVIPGWNSSLYSPEYWVVFLLNAAGIVITNIFMYFAFEILNDTTNVTSSELKVKCGRFEVVISIFFTNLQACHFIDNVLPDDICRIVKSVIYGLIVLFTIAIYIRRFRSFYYNIYHLSVHIVYFYCLISCLLEVVISITSTKVLTNRSVTTWVFCKLLASVFFLMINYLFNNQSVLMSQYSKVLFKQYNYEKYTYTELQVFKYFQYLLIHKDKMANQIHEICFSHRNKCDLDVCTCRNLKDDFSNAHIILKNIYDRLNFIKHREINVLYFEYILKIRKNEIFAYSVLKTYIERSYKHLSFLDMVKLYSLLVDSIYSFRYRYDKYGADYCHFKQINTRISIQDRFTKLFNKIIRSYEFFIEFKDKFDNYLKFEDGVVNSYIFRDIDNLVNSCNEFKGNYKRVKQNIIESFTGRSCQDIELSYKLKFFFKMFNGHVPLALAKHIHTEDENTDLIKSSGNDNNHYILFSINKQFEVKYFSYKLAELLGYQHNKLIGNDVHNIFPRELRDFHKKVILKHLLIDNKVRLNRKVFIFSNFNTIVPVYLKASAFTNFNNQLDIICDIQIIREEAKTYYFVLDSYFNMMSMNKNFAEVYSLDYLLLKKLNLDILKLMDVSQQTVRDSFRETFQYLSNQNELRHFFIVFSELLELNLDVAEFDKTYNIKHYYNTFLMGVKQNDGKEKDDLNISEQSYLPGVLNNTKTIIGSNRYVKEFSVYRDKQALISTLVRLRSRYIDLDLIPEDVAKLDSSIIKLKEKLNTIFKINISLKCFVDIVFYLVKIKEASPSFLQSEDTFSNVFLEKHFDFDQTPYKSLLPVTLLKPTSHKASFSLLKSKGKKVEKKLNKDYLKKIFKQRGNRSTLNLKAHKNIKQESTIIVIFIIIAAVLLVLHAFLFYYRYDFLNMMVNNFLAQYWINYQLSSLNFLHSSIITYMFNLAGLTLPSITNTTYQNNIKHWTNSYRAGLYQSYYLFNLIDDKSLLNLFTQNNQTFNKISVDWEDINFKTNLFSELNYLQYTAYQLSEDDRETLVSSVRDKFMFEKYKSSLLTATTDAERMIYYINHNIPNILESLYGSNDYVLASSGDIYNSYYLIINVFESCIIVLFVILIVLLKYLLNKYDRAFFQIILMMFLNNKKTKESNYKTPGDIINLKKNLKHFKNIIENIEPEINDNDETPEAFTNDIIVVKQDSVGSKKQKEIMIGKTKPVLKTNQNTTEGTISTQSNIPFVNNLKSLIRLASQERAKKHKQDDSTTTENKDSYTITNNNVLNDSKHHRLRIIKISNILLILGVLMFLTIAGSHILILNTKYDFMNQVQKTFVSFSGRFSLVAQLFNYVRLSVFNNDKQMRSNFSFDDLMAKISSTNVNFTTFLNDHPDDLPSVYNFLDSLINTPEATKDYLCPDTNTCQLNIKGLNNGYSSSLMHIEMIYHDFQKLSMAQPSVDTILSFFNSFEHLTVITELEETYGKVNDKVFELVYSDYMDIESQLYVILLMLGLLSVAFVILIILYLIFIFLNRIKVYMNSLVYSAHKFNHNLFS